MKHVKSLKYLALLSGENPTLPLSEIKAVLEIEKIDYKIIEIVDRIVIFKVSKDLPKKFYARLSMVHSIHSLLFKSALNFQDIVSSIKSAGIGRYAPECTTFQVRIKKIKCQKVNSEKLERFIGELIRKECKNKMKVDLVNPETRFFGFCHADQIYFCIHRLETGRKDIFKHPVTRRPFFHPTAMKPQVARIMVNLSKAKSGQTFLDPFCGSGSILVEAAFIGSNVLGMDINRKMIIGARKNMTFFNIKYMGLLQASITSLPIKGDFQAMATDPPYGRSSSTHGLNLNELTCNFLNEVQDLIGRGCRICFALPNNIRLLDLFDQKQLKIQETHEYYVHKSLTRKIFVLEKK